MADTTQSIIELKPHAIKINGTDGAVAGTSVDVRTYLSGVVYVYHAYVEAIANWDPVKYLIQINHSTTGEADKWITIAEFAATIIACDTTTLDNTAAIGQLVIPVTTTAGFAVGDIIYIKDLTGVDDSEWAQIRGMAGGISLATVDNLTGGNNGSGYVATDDAVYNDAKRWVMSVDLTGVSYLRVVSINIDPTGADWAEWSYGVFATDIE